MAKHHLTWRLRPSMEVVNHPAVSSRSFCAGSSFCAAPSPSFEYALVLVSRSTTLNLSICYKQTKKKRLFKNPGNDYYCRIFRLLTNTIMNLHYTAMKQRNIWLMSSVHSNLHVQHWNSILKPFQMTWFSHVFEDTVTVSGRECNHTLIPVN